MQKDSVKVVVGNIYGHKVQQKSIVGVSCRGLVHKVVIGREGGKCRS